MNDSAQKPGALVVDDDAIIRLDAAYTLQDTGYVVWEASNADEAYQLLERHADRIALLFTDVDMPGGSMNGFELSRLVDNKRPDIGILVASGRHTPAMGDMPEGAMFIGKPFSAEVVQDRLQQLPLEARPVPLRS